MSNGSFELQKKQVFNDFWNDVSFRKSEQINEDLFRIADKYFQTEYDDSPIATDFAEKLREVFYHAPEGSSTSDSLRIRVLAVTSDGVYSNFLKELIGRQTRNRCLYEKLDASSVSIGIESNGDIISLFDRSSQRAIILLSRLNFGLSKQYLAAPLRFVFEEYLRDTKYQLVHAGGLQNGDQVTLFIGPSGQGKSTTVAAGLLAGLTFLGDDYLIIVETRGAFHGFPLYASLKSSYHLGDTEPVLHKAAHCSDTLKNIFYLKSKNTFVFQSKALINHLVVPVITKQQGTTLINLDTFRVLQALLPSSLLQSHIINQSRAVRLRCLIQSARCYQMNVGRELKAIGDTIRSLGNVEFST